MDEQVTPRAPDPAIRVARLARRYGAVEALVALDLDVPRASFFALVGRNGAGKSTLFRIIAGLQQPDSGTVRVLGADPSDRAGRTALRRRLGLVPDFSPLFGPLTVRENALVLGRLLGLDRGAITARLDELARALAAEGTIDRPLDELSGGQRKLAALMVAMVPAPELLLLDEPFAGLDPIASRAVLDLLCALRERGVTLFVTSHDLALVARGATHVAVLDGGRLVGIERLGDAASRTDLDERILDALGRRTAPPDLAWYAP